MADDRLAAQRFWVMQALRLSGMALVIFGAMILGGRIAQSEAVGAALLAVGVVDFFVIPLVLAHRWKSGE